MKARVTRKAHFNAAHRLFNPSWTEEKNSYVFGKCANPNYHGHNYELQVSVSGNIDPETGYVVDLKLLDSLIRQEVLEKFDHKNLNLDTTEFKNLIPTTENIAVVIWNILRKKIYTTYELTVTVNETNNNSATYDGTGAY